MGRSTTSKVRTGAGLADLEGLGGGAVFVWVGLGVAVRYDQVTGKRNVAP